MPGLLADSLPDKFGNAVIDAWLALQGRDAAGFNPVERLCYIGSRDMGALEFQPAILGPPASANTIEVERLVTLANRVLAQRAGLGGEFNGQDDQEARTFFVSERLPAEPGQKPFWPGILQRRNSGRARWVPKAVLSIPDESQGRVAFISGA